MVLLLFSVSREVRVRDSRTEGTNECCNRQYCRTSVFAETVGEYLVPSFFKSITEVVQQFYKDKTSGKRSHRGVSQALKRSVKTFHKTLIERWRFYRKLTEEQPISHSLRTEEITDFFATMWNLKIGDNDNRYDEYLEEFVPDYTFAYEAEFYCRKRISCAEGAVV
ncbi:unnamed protein product [Thelazia callipaeda]|uniref:Transposase n=1 Tax=Thelazia callipaeda TaxID=103827 RepID=A0A0N5D1H7_THECL|nr:unnamed protein product [Thelazia callipaeda]